MSHRTTPRAVAVLALATSAGAAACAASTPGTDGEDVGEVSAALSSVPSDVACIDLEVANGARVVDQRFTVTPGQGGANLHLTGLPLGSDVLTGLAYPVTCASVTSTTNADWATNPVAVTLAAGAAANVSLQFHRAGSINVGIGFDDAGVTPWLVASPTSASYGGPCNATTAPKTFSFTNQGSATSKALTVAFTNNDPTVGHFAIPAGQDGCTGHALAVGASCTIAVDYVLPGCFPLNPSSTMVVSDGTVSAVVTLSGGFG